MSTRRNNNMRRTGRRRSGDTRQAVRTPPSVSSVERQAALLVNPGSRFSETVRTSTFTRVVKFSSIPSVTFSGPSTVQAWDFEDIFGTNDATRLAELYDEYCVEDVVIHLVSATAGGENAPDLLAPNSVSRCLSTINRDWSYPTTEVEFLNMRGLKGSMTRKCTEGAIFFHHIRRPAFMDKPQSSVPSPALALKRWIPTANPNIPMLGFNCCITEPQARFTVGGQAALTFTIQCRVRLRGGQ